MHPWLKNRLETLWAALPHPGLLTLFGSLQGFRIYLSTRPPSIPPNSLQGQFATTPWYAWALGWTLLLWLSTLNFAADRKKTFDKTSRNFFGAYLDHLIREGHLLYDRSSEPDFYFRVCDWQRKAIEGTAIGLGHEAAARFHQNMDSQYPMAKAYQESKDSGSGEPLCKALQGNLEELERMRKEFVPHPLDGKTDLAPLKKAESSGETDPRYLLK